MYRTLLTTVLAFGPPVELTVEQIFFDDAGNPLPDGLMTIRGYWDGPGPDDRIAHGAGTLENPLLFTVTGGTFFDSDLFVAGNRPPPFDALNFPGFEELRYDSWLTVGNSSADVGPDWPSGAPFDDLAYLGPGTGFDAGGETVWTGGPGGSTNCAWLTPPQFSDPGDGLFVPNPQTVAGSWPGQRVLLFQISITPDPCAESIFVEGTLDIGILVGGLPPEQVAAQFSFEGAAPSCPADVDCDGDVSVTDLVAVVLAWGDCPDCPEDVDDDGIVSVTDMVEVILAWGPCSP